MFSLKGISRTPKPPLPPVVKRMQWWQLGTMLVYGAVMLFIINYTRFVAWFGWLGFWQPLVVVAPTLVITFMLHRRLSHIKKALKVANGRACGMCLYDLSGQADTGVCPECGRAFDAAADQLSWARFTR